MMRLERGEYFLVILISVLVLLSAVLAVLKGVYVDLSQFTSAIVFNAIFIMVGQFYRRVRIDERIASVVTAVGLMMISGHVLKVFNYLLLPYQYHGADQIAAAVDAQFGFVWSSYVLFLAQYPAFCDLLKQVYLSCAWQIAAILMLLGITGKRDELSKFMLAIIIGGLLAIEVWAVFPSSTPAAFQAIPQDIANRLGLVVSPGQGNWLVQISHDGLRYLSPDELVGIVGFPSYHTVMALLSVYYARKVQLLFIPLVILNTLMLPAILLHGSHNLIDVFGGVALTVVSVWLAEKIAMGEAAFSGFRRRAALAEVPVRAE